MKKISAIGYHTFFYQKKALYWKGQYREYCPGTCVSRENQLGSVPGNFVRQISVSIPTVSWLSVPISVPCPIFNLISRSSLGLKSISEDAGTRPRASRLSMLSECAYHLRYIPADSSAHTHSISGPRPSGRLLLTIKWQKLKIN